MLNRLQAQIDMFNADSRLAYDLSLSAGIAGYESTSPLKLEEMLAEADRALYARKRGRRSTTRIRTPRQV
jgi:GGDEF domain-containing protein